MNKFQRILTNTILSSDLVPKVLRSKLLNVISGMDISPEAQILSNCFFDTNLVTVGSSFVNRFCKFHGGCHDAPIVIKDNCMIAMNVSFCTASHEIGDSTHRAGKSYSKPITIESGCWIGAHAVILGGVTIGEGCVIAAGAIVTKDCEPNGLYAGIPAKRIKDLPVGSRMED